MKIIHLLILFSLCTLAACAAPATDVAERVISATPIFTVAPTVTASSMPEPTAIPGLAVDDGVAEWQAPSLDLAAVQEMDQAQDEDLLAVAEAVLGEAKEMGLPLAQTSVIQFGEEDNFRAAVESRAANGNILWGLQHEGVTFRLTEQPVVLEWRDGAFHLVEMEYYEIPNSAEAVILGGQGSDGTLWTAFREPVTLADGSQLYALYYDMQVVREEKGKLAPGDWKFVPGVGIGKMGIIDGQAQRIDDQFNLENLGFAADELIRDGDNLMFQLGGLPVAVVDAQGKVSELTIEKAVFPEGTDPVVKIEKYTGPVEKDQGKLLGLNELGWAVTEFKDGKWVPFEREMKILGSNGEDAQLEPGMFPEGMLDALDPEDLKPLYMGSLYTPSGKKTDQYLGMHFPIEADGRLKTGYLGTWETYMHFYGGYVLGAVDQKVGGEGAWVVIEIPFKTQRQIVAYFIPSQPGYFNDIYGVHQEDKDLQPGEEALAYGRIPILYREIIDRFKNPELRGHQIVFAQQIKDWGLEKNGGRDRVFQSLIDGQGDEDPGWNWNICRLWVPEGFLKN